MGEVRVNFAAGAFAVLDDDNKVVQTGCLKEDSLANIANIAVDYGKVIDQTVDDDGKLLAMRISVPERKLKRLTKETQILANKRAYLGHIGYVLGLHSAVYISIDPKTKQPVINPDGDYSAVVEAMYVRKGSYMWATIRKEVYEHKRNPKLIEEFFWLRQLEREDISVELPEEIPNSTFEELLDSVTKILDGPTLFLTPRGRVWLARRYIGIVVGMMVRWGFKSDIKNLVAVGTDMSLDDRVDGRIYQSLMDAVKLAQKWGDL